MLLSVLAVSSCLAAVIAQPTVLKKPEWRTDISDFITKCADRRNYCVSREALVSASLASIDSEDYSDPIRFESDEFKEAPQGNASESTFPTL